MRAKPAYFGVLVALLAGAGAVYAQIEGGERGIAPIDGSANFEVGGIKVDVVGKTPESARLGGWRVAQRKGWQALWANTHAGTQAPNLSDSALDALVAGIVVDEEQVGPTRYVARLGVLFDRARTGQILGVSGGGQRSAPLLVLPVVWSGGTPTSFETRNDWQRAWARFRSGSSGIDYVRTSGNGADPLLLNAGQVTRRGRVWWRMLLDQYGASDVLVPQVRLERQWPGGPIIGYFSARHGPDNEVLGLFTLRVASSDGLPAMLDEGVRRLDRIYGDALATGTLRPDPSLFLDQPVALEPATEEAVDAEVTTDEPTPGTLAITVQVDTPDTATAAAIEGAVRSAEGVSAASTESLAVGGVSIMRVAFRGDLSGLRAALEARGLRAANEGGTLRISRGAITP